MLHERVLFCNYFTLSHNSEVLRLNVRFSALKIPRKDKKNKKDRENKEFSCTLVPLVPLVPPVIPVFPALPLVHGYLF